MPVELLNRQVQFKVGDIYRPDPVSVMDELYGNRLLEGEVLYISESSSGTKFAVVRVRQLKDWVVVAVERITAVAE